jgi:hypothetical protein
MAAVAADMAARHDELNRLDAAAGDGDLGNSVAIAAQAIRACVDASDESSQAIPAEERDYVQAIRAAEDAEVKIAIYASAMRGIAGRLAPVL